MLGQESWEKEGCSSPTPIRFLSFTTNSSEKKEPSLQTKDIITWYLPKVENYKYLIAKLDLAIGYLIIKKNNDYTQRDEVLALPLSS